MPKKKSNFEIDLAKDIWPQERDIIEKPERYKYVRKLIKSKGCVFCDALKSGITAKSLVLFKSKYSMVVLNKYPYNSGHLLILPQAHIGSLLDLKNEQYLDLMLLMKESTRILYKAYGCDALNLGMNHGRVAGAGIPDHLHWHLIPRWSGDTNFFPLIAETKVLPETIGQSYKKLKPYFKNLKVEI